MGNANAFPIFLLPKLVLIPNVWDGNHKGQLKNCYTLRKQFELKVVSQYS